MNKLIKYCVAILILTMPIILVKGYANIMEFLSNIDLNDCAIHSKYGSCYANFKDYFKTLEGLLIMLNLTIVFVFLYYFSCYKLQRK